MKQEDKKEDKENFVGKEISVVYANGATTKGTITEWKPTGLWLNCPGKGRTFVYKHHIAEFSIKE